MELIDKAALVAEIEKVMDEPTPPHDPQCPWEDGYLFALSKAESIIDTLEVKEVDLEKENLTWKDIRELYIIFAEIDAEIEFCKTDIQGETIGYYQEVLKRFKAQKGE